MWGKPRDFKVGDPVVYKQSGEVKEITKAATGTRVCIRTDDGDEFWVDADRLRDKRGGDRL